VSVRRRRFFLRNLNLALPFALASEKKAVRILF
jgi:hypothetical protein